MTSRKWSFTIYTLFHICCQNKKILQTERSIKLVFTISYMQNS
ncbi:hypothetical protein GCWU000246_01619 [Jonquetella anthropi E3_33 E1]|nr:hypothetical protein GCWU000246_01619 [Jonquetella anthropi E3_33 E1]